MRRDIILVFSSTQYFYGKYEDWVFKGLEEFECVYGKDIVHQRQKEQDVREFIVAVYQCITASFQSWSLGADTLKVHSTY